MSIRRDGETEGALALAVPEHARQPGRDPSPAGAPWRATIWFSSGTDAASSNLGSSARASWPASPLARTTVVPGLVPAPALPPASSAAAAPNPSSRTERTLADRSKAGTSPRSAPSAPSRPPGSRIESVPTATASNRSAGVRRVRELIASTDRSNIPMHHDDRPRVARSVRPLKRARKEQVPWWRKLATALGALVLAGCTVVGRDHEAPETELPQQFLEQPGAAVLRDDPELAHWWRRLDDPILNGLVERAAAGSLDLRAALARVREARALRGVARSEYWPTVDLSGSYTRLDESENTPFGSFAEERDVHDARLDASWELDLWGRVRRSVEAADADLAATIEDARDVQVSVAAEVALAYVDLRAYQRRFELARTNVALQEETLDLVRARFDAGLVGERDVAQALTNLQTTRSRVPQLEVGARAAENRLAVLLGVAPGTLSAELSLASAIPVAPLQVAVGVPAELLRRRPDIRRAERALAAETARVGVAEGDLYPRLSLFGNLGFQAEDAADLFESDSRVFGIGPSLRWNVFSAGRLRDRVEAQEARVQQAAAAWEGTVLAALEETENALAAFVREQSRRSSLSEAAAHARRSVELARTQYTEGLSDFQAVLDSERALADLEDTLAQSSAAITTHLVRLYKALGGGWEHGIGEQAIAGR